MSLRGRPITVKNPRWNKLYTKTKVGETAEDCWTWEGAKTTNGYGVCVWYDNKKKKHEGMVAHRAMYIELVGEIPEGLTLDHLCRNILCVNPRHMEPVTQRVNIHRSPIQIAAINAQKTHCSRGHQRWGKKVSGRYCLECHRTLEIGRRKRRVALSLS